MQSQPEGGISSFVILSLSKDLQYPSSSLALATDFASAIGRGTFEERH
jgi:hypothetical protein